MQTEPSKIEDLPAPDAAVVLWRVSLQAHLRTLSRKRGERFLKEMGAILASEEAASEILPIRPKGSHRDVQHARRGAVAIFRAMLPVLLASLPPG